MFHHIQLTKGELNLLIKKGAIKFGGNKKLKIYGTLSCDSGKRMKKENRLFFQSEAEAIDRGYRPCGHCMRDEYQRWKRKRLSPP
jgi:methylphosphotriester-DNA--protein-cysteine methyltransferase